jgi:hypothetical protein
VRSLSEAISRRPVEPESSVGMYHCYAHRCPNPGVFAEGVSGIPKSVCWVHDAVPASKWPQATEKILGMGRYFRLYAVVVTQEGRIRAGALRDGSEDWLEGLAEKAARELNDPELAIQDSDYLTQRNAKNTHGPVPCHSPNWYRYAMRLRKIIKQRCGAE